MLLNWFKLKFSKILKLKTKIPVRTSASSQVRAVEYVEAGTTLNQYLHPEHMIFNRNKVSLLGTVKLPNLEHLKNLQNWLIFDLL